MLQSPEQNSPPPATAAKNDAAFLWDMLDAAKAISQFVAIKSFRDYDNDRMLRNAVERNIELIGLAAGGVSPALQAAHPEIPWRGLVVQRDALLAGQAVLDHKKMWVAVSEFIPYLVKTLTAVIPTALQH